MSNEEIRIAMIKANIKQYQVADKLKIAEHNFSRKLRYELSEKEKARVLKAIEELKQENKQEVENRTEMQKKIVEEQIVLLDMKDVQEITNWSEGTIKKLIATDKNFPILKQGKTHLVELSAFKQYLGTRYVKEDN